MISDFEERPLLVVALGGNALSPADSGENAYTTERARCAATCRQLNRLLDSGYRLIIVHGNGPQVGRLMSYDSGSGNLDIHVAQTQGELGYLLMASLDEPATCVLTRVVVPVDPGPPIKAIGPVLPELPRDDAPTVSVTGGWRYTVPSPRPERIVESDLIDSLSGSHHVIAGGGGGVPLDADGQPVPAVVDKDWVASELAIRCEAAMLLFVTDVDHVYERYGTPHARAIEKITPELGRSLIEDGGATPGSMAPKIDAALSFAENTHAPTRICALEDIEAAVEGRAGTAVHGDSQD